MYFCECRLIFIDPNWREFDYQLYPINPFLKSELRLKINVGYTPSQREAGSWEHIVGGLNRLLNSIRVRLLQITTPIGFVIRDVWVSMSLWCARALPKIGTPYSVYSTSAELGFFIIDLCYGKYSYSAAQDVGGGDSVSNFERPTYQCPIRLGNSRFIRETKKNPIASLSEWVLLGTPENCGFILGK